MKNITIHRWLLLGILLLALLVRMYRITRPIADWHSWRQSDTSAVTRYFVSDGVDLLHPRFEDISNMASGKDNPAGYRMVEFPIFNLMHYIIYLFLGTFGASLELAGRLTTVLASLGSIIFLYLIIQKRSRTAHAAIAGMLMAVLPYSIFYSSVILPDPMMVMAYLGSTYFFMLMCDTDNKKQQIITAILTVLLGACALLLKPTAIFWLASLGVFAFERWGLGAVRKWWLWMLVFFIILPVTWWRNIWIVQYPEGIAANTWLYNSNHIRFTGAWLRWLFFERIGNLMLGGYGVFFLVGGFLKRWNKGDLLYWSWAVGSIVYLIVFATGNVQHDYYQIPLIPMICTWVAAGIITVLRDLKSKYYIRLLIVPVVTGIMLAISWYNVRGYFNINNPAIIEVGSLADKRLPLSAKVVAPYNGDTAFLYYINRPGWPFAEYPIEVMINKGATYYVSVTHDALTKQLEQQFEVDAADETKGYWIINLTKPKI